MSSSIKLEQVVQWAAQVANTNSQIIDEFKKELDSNPMSAFTFSNRAFKAAAYVSVFSSFVSAASSPSFDIKQFMSNKLKDLLIGMQSIDNNTSPTVNLAENCARAARAELYQYLESCGF